MTDPKIERLLAACREMIAATRWLDETYQETQELYNAMRAITGEACEHEWYPKGTWEDNGVVHHAFTHCGKCGETRDPPP